MYKKIIKICIGISVFILTFSLFFPSPPSCKHEQRTEIEFVSPTCVSDGVKQIVCVDCEEVIEERAIPILSHSFSDYNVIEEPSANKDGFEIRSCLKCGLIESREVVCPHDDVLTKVISEPTCDNYGVQRIYCNVCKSLWQELIPSIEHSETDTVISLYPTCLSDGIENVICKQCNGIVETYPISKTECVYGDWIICKYATPFENGSRKKICKICADEEFENYTVDMEDNFLYIPSAGILAEFKVDYFTQKAVDSNDIIYTVYAYGVKDENNPFILGHWYGSLSNMYKTLVGDCIYICLDGKIETYEVKVSEYGVMVGGHKMYNKTTGNSVWDAYSSELLSNISSYGGAHGGIDRDESSNDGKTLHMYTCHYGEGNEEWSPYDGHNGRWIVVADLVDSHIVDTN